MSQYRITATITSQTQATDSGAWQMGITWRKSLTLDPAETQEAADLRNQAWEQAANGIDDETTRRIWQQVDTVTAREARQRPVERHGSPNQAARLHRRVRARGIPAAGDLTTTTHDQGRPTHTPGRPSPGEEANMRRHAMDEWIDTGDEEGAAKAFDAMDERIRPPIGAQPRQITPSRTTLDACQRAGCPIEAGAIHAWLCTWSVRSIDGTVIRRDMLLIDVKRENEIWKATSRYRLDGIRTGRQAQAALLLAATGALRPIQERFK